MRTGLITVFVLLLAACGASSDYERPAYEQPPVASNSTRPEIQVVAASEDSSFFGKQKRSAPDPGSTGGAGPATRAPAQKQGIDQKLVKNAYLTVEVKDEKDYPEAIARSEKIAKRLDGYIASQTRSSITFKIPTGRLDEALAAVGELGKVKHRDVTAVDVTANYVDLQIRIENLRKVRGRLQQLVEQGKNVKEILEVEKELARVTSQLESLEGQMRVLENQTTFATVSVTFKERVRPGPLGWISTGCITA